MGFIDPLNIIMSNPSQDGLEGGVLGARYQQGHGNRCKVKKGIIVVAST